ncbi:MAG: NAD-dependent succinate-semialdehyde dehydrogenase [Chlorobiales bacterium]|nr:NAD-dependent succinate-semialdehyde dehydrogenase [Chlorobiales bacterium]
MKLESINPATGEKFASYEEMSMEALEQILALADKDALAWKKMSFESRGGYLKKVAALLRQNSREFAELIAREMGKPVAQGAPEVEKCAWVCEFYAEKAQEFLAPEIIETDAQKSYVAFSPLGIVLGIMPWNFPFWQVFRFVAPALMAGNACVVKHAPNVTGSALAIEKVFRNAGLPENLYRTLLISPEHVAERTSRLIENPLVSAVTVTGSTAAGKSVASKAGQFLKKTVMELGGNDPYIVLEDADLEEAIGACVASRLQNCGQSCVSAKRFVIVGKVKQEFEERLVKAMSAKKIGDPLQPGTDLGPIARADLRDNLHRQVEESISKGATVLLGGTMPEGKGYFYPPTILTNVKKGMPAYSEETFGPAASIITVENEDEAVEVANDTEYGLGSAVFSRDIKRAEAVAAKIEAGNSFVNAMVKSDPRLPFGGIKESGYGRELSYFGIREFVNIKTIYIK